MNYFKKLNSENKYFKPFKKGDRLLNNIYKTLVSSNKLYYVFSTSHCKNKKVCIITIDTIKNSKLEIYKVESLLKMYTWSIKNNSIKTNDNGISYSFKSMLNRYNIKINYTTHVKSTSHIEPKFFNIIVNIIYLEGLSYKKA